MNAEEGAGPDSIDSSDEEKESIQRTIRLFSSGSEHWNSVFATSIASIPPLKVDASTVFSKALASIDWRRFSQISSPALYKTPDVGPGSYSPEFESPDSYFKKNEGVIDSFADLHDSVTRVVEANPSLRLVWRGQQRSDWALHSQLYRQLVMKNRVKQPKQARGRKQELPDETQMVTAEKRLLDVARTEWRFDNLSALELFARVQHAGGPTRLIDVTLNPYIAAWFAVESSREHDTSDGRLFALSVGPVTKSDMDHVDPVISLDSYWGGRQPPWHLLSDAAERQEVDWGTGSLRRLWVPPAYDPRIPAQNAAFILDGVPITSAKTAPYFIRGKKNEYWRRADLLASSSIFAKTQPVDRAARYNEPKFAPTFTFRISAAGKADIREALRSRFGYTPATIYPDFSGLSSRLRLNEL